MRFCRECLLCKDQEKDFPTKKAHISGYALICKECDNIGRRKRYRIFEDKKEKKPKPPFKIRGYDENGVYINRVNEYNRERYKANFVPKPKTRFKRSDEEKRKASREYYQKNKEEIKRKVWIYRKNKMKTDILFKLISYFRSNLTSKIKRSKIEKKGRTTNSVLGADIFLIKKHLERKFKKGMNWNNYGRYGWHIDHIIPLASAKNEEELMKLFHYTNLQPLWASDNLKKSNKIFDTQLILTI